jgi:hypothetical protein
MVSSVDHTRQSLLRMTWRQRRGSLGGSATAAITATSVEHESRRLVVGPSLVPCHGSSASSRLVCNTNGKITRTHSHSASTSSLGGGGWRSQPHRAVNTDSQTTDPSALISPVSSPVAPTERRCSAHVPNRASFHLTRTGARRRFLVDLFGISFVSMTIYQVCPLWYSFLAYAAAATPRGWQLDTAGRHRRVLYRDRHLGHKSGRRVLNNAHS